MSRTFYGITSRAMAERTAQQLVEHPALISQYPGWSHYTLGEEFPVQ